ncbi:hypothetical protein [Bradyrhizobium sp. Mp27]|uniref:hypothetical protein n=1 Tax=Bradyrhizobium sp. Mp27 TaxID=3042157 RepID=UPI00248CC360|nr:hypothetical protein [Bradyrhizobium sp. Mp27]MDI2076150.1 hypothetical protein [Bradyrhizobium sp. Mp27]
MTTAARNGNRAKRRLARKLASLTPDQLRRINPEVFARLGPQGLLLFAALSKNIRDVASTPAPAKVKQTRSGLENVKRSWHFAHPLLKCLAVTALCGVIGVITEHLSHPLLETIGGRRTEVVARWPVCARLDFVERDRVYRASSGQLTIDRVVALTGLTPDVVVAANPHLDFRLALPPGSLVVIPNSHP